MRAAVYVINSRYSGHYQSFDIIFMSYFYKMFMLRRQHDRVGNTCTPKYPLKRSLVIMWSVVYTTGVRYFLFVH